MSIRLGTIVFDTDDLEAESTFWSRVLGGTVHKDDDWHELVVDGAPRIAFQLAPDHVRPRWPDGEPQQVHLDLYVDDVAASHADVTAAGAEFLRGSNVDAEEGFRVYADPSGHPFCLCW
ncbi:MAG: VOC family protein [Cryobacterium sp.]|nr:VOC family protein [Cryobacterium sp.]